MATTTQTPRTARRHTGHSRPLTNHELHSIALALAESIMRHRTRLRTAMGTEPGIFAQMRTASEALFFTTDHICNDHRWGDDGDDDDDDDDEADEQGGDGHGA